MNSNRSTQSTPFAEPLESRRLLAATIVDGVLVATGSSGADIISIRRVLTDDVVLTINGAAKTFDMDDFTGVRLEGLGGNDAFNLIDPLVSPVVRNTTVIGGEGDDTVSYETRTAATTFRGYIQPDITVTPFVEAVSGAQTDRIMPDVERFVGGSADDHFVINNLAEVDERLYPLPDLVLEGRGGDDSFGNPYQLRAVMHGGAGNDFLSCDDGALGDTFFGGDGDDRVKFNNFGRPTVLDGGAGNDTIDARDFVVTGGFIDMREFAGVENLINVSDPAEIFGNDLDNHIDASNADGIVTILGAGGHDTLIGGNRADLIEGGEGNDSLVGNDGNDTLDGGPGIDTLVGGAGDNILRNGEAGDANPTSPTIAITGGILVARGTGGNDTFTVRRHLTDNVIVTVNSLSREFDMDDFNGVRLEGFGGNDAFRLIDPLTTPVIRKTTVLGGAGNDTLDYSTRTAALQFTIDPTDPADNRVISGAQDDRFADVETLIGGSGGDSFTYGQSNDAVEGVTTSYRLEGRGGNDVFRDVVWPNSDAYGSVTMLGGNGADHFRDESDQRFTREFFFGEAGNDTATHYRRGGSFDGGSGIDSMFFEHFESAGWDLRNFPGFDNATASSQGESEAVISLTGNDLPNRLQVNSGRARINGLGGNDTVIGADEDDEFTGGDGNDTLDYTARTDGVSFVYDTAATGSTAGRTGETDEFNGFETILGGSGNDTFRYGSSGPPQEPSDGNPGQPDTEVLFDGRAGNDLIIDSLATFEFLRGVTLVGGDGNDTFDCDEIGAEQYFGGAGNDLFRFHNEAGPHPSFSGGAGVDTLDLTDGFPVGSGGDVDMRQTPDIENAVGIRGSLIGNALANHLSARPGSDPVTIRGGGGSDTIVGAAGADSLLGEDGNDWLVGQDGNDTLDGGAGTDTIDGGAGSNTNLNGEVLVGQQVAIGIVNRVLNVIGTGAGEPISLERTGTDNVIARVGGVSREFDMDDFDGVSVLGLGGNDVITIKQALVAGSLVRKVTIDGGGGNDSITGASGDDVLRGNTGADTLLGLGGRDALFGGAGNDRLVGGLGLDFLDGGDNDDFCDAREGVAGDTVQGGNGLDTAEIDAGDGATNVEVFA